MRFVAAIAACLLSGCLIPSNEISGRWMVGGPGGCAEGDGVSVSVPEDTYWDGYTHYTCAEREFSIAVSQELTEFRVELDVWPLVDRGIQTGATVELFRVVDDFNLGVVTFVEQMP